MTEEQIADIWTLFKEYLDKKQVEASAERYVDLLADYGIGDDILKECLGASAELDNAILYYLELDDDPDDEDDEWDE